MRALVAVLALASTSGCMALLCGETVYFSTPPSAVVVFAGEYNATRANEGLRAIPSGEGAARATPSSTTHIQLALDFASPCEGPSQEAVFACLREQEDKLTPRVDAAAAAFENATGWKRTSGVVWQQGGVGHGDC